MVTQIADTSLKTGIVKSVVGMAEHLNNSPIIATHGIIKKTNKTPKKEIEKAKQLRVEYLKSK